MRFGGVDVNPFEASEWSCVEPWAIGEKRVAAEIGDGGFEMEAAGNADRDHFVIVGSEDRGELAGAFGIGACGLADIESATDEKDVATFDGAGGGDVGEFAETSEGSGQGFGFGLAGFCAEWEDDREFVEDDGGVFNEHRVREICFGGEGVDADTEVFEEMFVGCVLSLGFGDVDGLAIDEGEFAIGEGGAYSAGYGG